MGRLKCVRVEWGENGVCEWGEIGVCGWGESVGVGRKCKWSGKKLECVGRE